MYHMKKHQVIHINWEIKKELSKRKIELSSSEKREVTWNELMIRKFKLPFELEPSGRGNKVVRNETPRS